MANAIKNAQREDGFWNTNLADPNNFGGIETSGTSCFIYGLAYGVRNGYLDYNTYYPVMKKAFDSYVTTAISQEGRILYVQGVADQPGLVDANNTHSYVYGLFDLGLCEIMKMCSDYALPALNFPAETYPQDPNKIVETGFYTGSVNATGPAQAGAPENSPDKLFDKEWEFQDASVLSYRWAVAGFPQTANVDLLTTLDLRKITVVPYGSRPYLYTIESSLDGSEWTTIATQADVTDKIYLYNHTVDTSARYLRFTVTGCGIETTFVNIMEMLLFTK